MNHIARPVGGLLREWRQRRRLSQLELACEARISTRHLSFLETGRSQPSRDMVLHLAEQLDVPMRERNVLLVAAGFAPSFGEHALDDPALGSVRDAIDMVLERQKPYPAFAIDRHWRVVASNSALQELYEGCAGHLLERPVNGLRLTLHPEGMAPRIDNLAEWRAHILARLKQQIDMTADPVLIALRRELLSYRAPSEAHEFTDDARPSGVAEGGVTSSVDSHAASGSPHTRQKSQATIPARTSSTATTRPSRTSQRASCSLEQASVRRITRSAPFASRRAFRAPALPLRSTCAQRPSRARSCRRAS